MARGRSGGSAGGRRPGRPRGSGNRFSSFKRTGVAVFGAAVWNMLPKEAKKRFESMLRAKVSMTEGQIKKFLVDNGIPEWAYDAASDQIKSWLRVNMSDGNSVKNMFAHSTVSRTYDVPTGSFGADVNLLTYGPGQKFTTYKKQLVIGNDPAPSKSIATPQKVGLYNTHGFLWSNQDTSPTYIRTAQASPIVYGFNRKTIRSYSHSYLPEGWLRLILAGHYRSPKTWADAQVVAERFDPPGSNFYSGANNNSSTVIEYVPFSIKTKYKWINLNTNFNSNVRVRIMQLKNEWRTTTVDPISSGSINVGTLNHSYALQQVFKSLPATTRIGDSAYNTGGSSGALWQGVDYSQTSQKGYGASYQMLQAWRPTAECQILSNKSITNSALFDKYYRPIKEYTQKLGPLESLELETIVNQNYAPSRNGNLASWLYGSEPNEFYMNAMNQGNIVVLLEVMGDKAPTVVQTNATDPSDSPSRLYLKQRVSGSLAQKIESEICLYTANSIRTTPHGDPYSLYSRKYIVQDEDRFVSATPSFNATQGYASLTDIPTSGTESQRTGVIVPFQSISALTSKKPVLESNIT